MTYITQDELEIPRKASEVRQWVDNKIEKIGSSEEGKQAVRFREGLLKELIEEALPLGIFCDLYFGGSDKVIVTHTVGNQNFDVTIEDNRDSKTPLEYLEITQAHENEDAHLRMLKFKEEGHVNSLGRVTKRGTKHTRITIEVENEAVEHSVVFNNEAQKILNAAKRKSGKEYPDNTGLIIICDDYIAFRDKSDPDRFIEFIHYKVLPLLDNFSKVFVIGWSSKTYLEF